MRKIWFVAVILAILLFSGCQPESKNEITEFPVLKTIGFKEISVPDILAIPGEIIVQNEKVIVLDLETDWFFKVFSMESFDFLGSIIRKGRGPEEEVMISPYFRAYGDDAFLFQGAGTVKIGKVRTSQDGLAFDLTEKYELPVEMYDDTDFFLINGKLCSSISYQPLVKDFRGFCLETGELFQWGEMLPLNKPVSDPGVPFVLEKLTTIKPDGQRLATVYGKLPTVRIYYPEDGRLLSEMQVTHSSKNKEILLDNSSDYIRDGLINYYFRIKSTNDYIYALYQGQPVVEFSLEGGVPKYQDVASELHIWDWNGNPILNLKFERSVFSFDVTPDNKQIIALSIVDVDKLFVSEIPWD